MPLAPRTTAPAPSGPSKPAVPPPPEHELVQSVLSEQHVDIATGLTGAEADKRLQQHGPNALVETRVSTWQRIAGYFWGPIPWMIEIAAMLSLVVGDWSDFAIIATMLLVNAGVEFWEENKADNAIELLKQKLAPTARVLRDGNWQTLDAHDLVPGDVVMLQIGNITPADVVLAKGDYLSADESALTGESLPVDKKVGDRAYSGSAIKIGEMRGVVTATGMNTYFGKTAQLVQTAQQHSHFQRAVLKIGNFLILSTLALVAIIVIFALFRHEPLLRTVEFALILTVAAIPVALPTVLSVTMAVGAERLAAMKAIVSRLVAIEELAGVDVLCADKTGTLTKNELTLGQPAPADGVSEDDIILAAALASPQEEPDAIDRAVLSGLKDDKALQSYTLGKFTPFDPVSKRTEAQVSDGGRQLRRQQGRRADDPCAAKLDDAAAAAVNKQVDAFAADGYRTIAVARKPQGGDWQFLGLLPIFDPPRDDSAETIKRTEEMGVDVKMITGDHEAISRQIAGRLDLTGRIVSADQIFAADNSATNPNIVGGDRALRRRRAGVSGAQVQDRQGAAERGQPHRRHDRRRRQRCAGPEAGRCRHRRLRRDRRRPRRRRPGAHRARPVGDHRGDRGGAAHLRADDELCDLPHRRDHPRAVVHDAVDPAVQFLSGDGGDDRAAGAAQRLPDHDDRL